MGQGKGSRASSEVSVVQGGVGAEGANKNVSVVQEEEAAIVVWLGISGGGAG